MKQKISEEIIHLIKDVAILISLNRDEITSRTKEILFDTHPDVKIIFDKAQSNQALLIAKELAKITNKACISDLLVRKINNRPQVGLLGKERLKNVKGVFSINED